MTISASIDISAPPASVWAVVTDVRNASAVISGIKSIDILEEATGPSVVGLKWRETREFMGRDATEVIWITDASAESYYATRAESHGSVYLARIGIEPAPAGSRLTMDFDCQPVTLGAKVMWALTGWMARGSLRKVISQDLQDIKAAVEKAA